MFFVSRTPTIHGSLDFVGATTSFVCAVHCAVVALLLGAMPAMSFLASPVLEWLFLGASAAIGLAALLPGYRVHRQPAPMILFTLGIGSLTALRSMHLPPSTSELLVVLAAASCIISAHWKNRGAMHRCECGPEHHHRTSR
jgi:hypothetical protein